MYDERFARQYRYEPPSEFPLSLPFTGIVHHLSGPNKHALTQTLHQWIKVGRCCVNLAPITFISPVGFSTTRLARVLDSLVRVSRRVGKIHFAKIAQSPSSRTRPANRRCVLPPLRQPPLPSYDPILAHAASLPPRSRRVRGAATRIFFYRFRLNDFRSFNSLFKVLFIFPSQYLFAIGFPHVFSLRRSLSPT